MTQHVATRGMRTFTIIWFGQLISLLGSGLTSFALSVWVFQSTGSVTLLTFASLSAVLPIIVLSPLTGALVDRWDRRWVMILSDSGAALSTLFIALLLLAGRLEVWHIYVAVAVIGTCTAFQRPAYSASITLLVPNERLGRANGMVQSALAISNLISPVMAGVLIALIQAQGVILIDFVTFLFAVTTLLIVRIPRPRATTRDEAKRSSLRREVTYGLTYVTARPGLAGLLILYAVNNFLVATVGVLATPLVLGFTSAAVLGTLLSIGGIGMLVGSVVMSAWGGPKRRIYGLLGFFPLCGLAIVLAGLRPSALLIAVGGFIAFFSAPIVNSSTRAIFQSKVALDVQGRVFAVMQMIAGSTAPMAYLVAGPLADHVFEPLLATNGPLAGSIGQIIGVGPGRGIGLLFILAGILLILATAIGYLYPRLRLVEDELPDATTDEAPIGAEGTKQDRASHQPQFESAISSE